jgi:hypothetical protein
MVTGRGVLAGIALPWNLVSRLQHLPGVHPLLHTSNSRSEKHRWVESNSSFIIHHSDVHRYAEKGMSRVGARFDAPSTSELFAIQTGTGKLVGHLLKKA